MERELAARMRRVVVYSVLALLGLVVALVYLGANRLYWSASHYMGFGWLSAGMTALVFWGHFRLQYMPVRIDKELTSRTAELAARLSVSPKEVWITEAFFGQDLPGLYKLRDRFLVSPKLIATLSSEEMDFVLAQLLAQSPAVSIRAFVFPAAGMITYVFLLMAIIFEALWRHLLAIPMAWAGFCYLLLCIDLWKAGIVRNYIADLKAIEVTRDRDAAISFLAKFANAKGEHKLSGMIASHMAKRLEMLRAPSSS